MPAKSYPETGDVLEDMQQQVQKETAPAPVRRWRALAFQAYVILAIALFALLAGLARSIAYFSVDVAITRFLQDRNSELLDLLMRVVSWPGYAPQVVAIVLLVFSLLYFLRFKREAHFILLTGFGALLTNTLVKAAIARPRPAPDLVDVFSSLSSFSFPSGHVMFYTAFFGFIAFLAYSLMRRSWLRLFLLLLSLSLVAMVGLSRVYLGEHWTSDVVGGYLLGSLILLGVVWGYRKTEDK